VHEAALRALSRRALSRAELSERLLRKGYDEASVRREIERLLGLEFLDDEALAKAVCESAVRRGYGRRAALATLYRRKVPRPVAEAAVARLGADDVEAALRRTLGRALRKYPTWNSLPGERRKVIRYLLTRGFGAEAVRDALAAVDGDEWDAEDEIEPLDPPELP